MISDCYTQTMILTMISNLTLRSGLLMLIYDLLHSDINIIHKSDTRSNIEIWFSHVDIWSATQWCQHDLKTDISSDTDYDIGSNGEIWFTHVDMWSTANIHQHDS